MPSYGLVLPDQQDYAVAQERFRHDQAMGEYGEYSMFLLMWNRMDFDAGLVEECMRCVSPLGRIADVYQQPSDSKCPECFGTRYEGGFKARLVRPALWDMGEDVENDGQRGTTVNQTASVQTTADFRLRAYDYIFRADGSRWQMRTLGSNRLHTGFGTIARTDVIGYNFGTVNREDEGSVAYLIPPDAAGLAALLDVEHAHYPLDFSAAEVIRAPILIESP